MFKVSVSTFMRPRICIPISENICSARHKTDPTDTMGISKTEWILNISGIKARGTRVHTWSLNHQCHKHSQRWGCKETPTAAPEHPCLVPPRAGKEHKVVERTPLTQTWGAQRGLWEHWRRGKAAKKEVNLTTKAEQSRCIKDLSVKNKSYFKKIQATVFDLGMEKSFLGKI